MEMYSFGRRLNGAPAAKHASAKEFIDISLLEELDLSGFIMRFTAEVSQLRVEGRVARKASESGSCIPDIRVDAAPPRTA